jgi:DNA-binding CsgD family transcriptional regulator
MSAPLRHRRRCVRLFLQKLREWDMTSSPVLLHVRTRSNTNVADCRDRSVSRALRGMIQHALADPDVGVLSTILREMAFLPDRLVGPDQVWLAFGFWEVEVRAGQTEQAERWAHAIMRSVREADDPVVTLCARRMVVEQAINRREECGTKIASLETAFRQVRANENREFVLETAGVAWTLGREAECRRNRTRAQLWFETAAEIFVDVGQRRWAAIARRRATNANVGTQRLSPSERRVAELAAAGLMNSQIANSLLVSVKTIECMLTNSYLKLGIARRAQLSEALRGADL